MTHKLVEHIEENQVPPIRADFAEWQVYPMEITRLERSNSFPSSEVFFVVEVCVYYKVSGVWQSRRYDKTMLIEGESLKEREEICLSYIGNPPILELFQEVQAIVIKEIQKAVS